MHIMTLFVVSTSVITFIVMFRSLEIMIKRDIIPARVRDGVDRRVVRFMAICVRSAWRLRRALQNQIKKVPLFFLHILVHVWGVALKQTVKAVTRIQGRGDGTARGILAKHLEAVRAYEKQLRNE